MSYNGFIDAGYFARQCNTTPDVVVTLIQQKEIPGVKINNKWYVKKNSTFRSTPERCRLIHIANVHKLRRIELNIPSHNIRIKGTEKIVYSYLKVKAQDNTYQLYFEPSKREYLIQKNIAEDNSEFKNITAILESNELEQNKDNIRNIALLLIEEYKYKKYMVYGTGANLVKLLDTEVAAVEFAEKIAKESKENTTIRVQHFGKVIKIYSK